MRRNAEKLKDIMVRLRAKRNIEPITVLFPDKPTPNSKSSIHWIDLKEWSPSGIVIEIKLEQRAEVEWFATLDYIDTQRGDVTQEWQVISIECGIDEKVVLLHLESEDTDEMSVFSKEWQSSNEPIIFHFFRGGERRAQYTLQP